MLKRIIPLVAALVLIISPLFASPVAANESGRSSTVSGTDFYCYPFPYPDPSLPYGPNTPPVTSPWKGWSLNNCKFTPDDPRLTGVNYITISARFSLANGTGVGAGTFRIQSGKFTLLSYQDVAKCGVQLNCFEVVKSLYPSVLVEFYNFVPNGSGWEGAFASKLVVLNANVPVVATSSSIAAGAGIGQYKGLVVEATVRPAIPDPLQYPITYRIIGHD